MRGRSRFLTTLAAVGLVGAVASACKPEVTKEVLFVNDSVTHQSVGAIVETMNAVPSDSDAGRYAPNFGSSVPGIGLGQVPGVPEAEVDGYWVTHLDSLLTHVDPEVIVVELGYNDCGYDLSAYGDRIDNFMSRISPSTPVHWLTVADAHDRTTCDETINAELSDATTRFANLSLFDFAAHMQGHPEWTDDGTHLNADGQRGYARWLHDQLDALYVTEPPVEPPAEPPPA